MSKIKIGGIMQTTDLAKVGVMSIPDRPGIVGKIMAALGKEGINVQFVVQCIDIQNNDHVVFCISEEQCVRAQSVLEAIQEELGAERVTQRTGVAILSIFGPDFRERPGVAGTMFAALGEKGINILAISTSISTISCVIDAPQLDQAVAVLRETFDLP